jgi:beta-fructofuranosidase
MESLGRGLERRLAALDDPAEQERLIHEAARADGELRAGR